MKTLRNETFVFLIVGSTTVFIDLGVYRTLLIFDVDLSLSKAVSFTTGSIFAYFANKSWTFNSTSNGIKVFTKFAFIYLSGLGINVGMNSLLVSIFGLNEISLLISFIIATLLSATTNFLGMKYFVFLDKAI